MQQSGYSGSVSFYLNNHNMEQWILHGRCVWVFNLQMKVLQSQNYVSNWINMLQAAQPNQGLLSHDVHMYCWLLFYWKFSECSCGTWLNACCLRIWVHQSWHFCGVGCCWCDDDRRNWWWLLWWHVWWSPPCMTDPEFLELRFSLLELMLQLLDVGYCIT